MFASLKRTLKYRKIISDWQKHYNLDAPKRGSIAPDFSLQDITGDQTIRLSDYKGKKPVALVFGSFT